MPANRHDPGGEAVSRARVWCDVLLDVFAEVLARSERGGPHAPGAGLVLGNQVADLRQDGKLAVALFLRQPEWERPS